MTIEKEEQYNDLVDQLSGKYETYIEDVKTFANMYEKPTELDQAIRDLEKREGTIFSLKNIDNSCHVFFSKSMEIQNKIIELDFFEPLEEDMSLQIEKIDISRSDVLDVFSDLIGIRSSLYEETSECYNLGGGLVDRIF